MAGRGTLKFERNLGADRGCMRTKFEGAQLRDRNFRGRQSAKVDKFEPAYLGNYRY